MGRRRSNIPCFHFFRPCEARAVGFFFVFSLPFFLSKVVIHIPSHLRTNAGGSLFPFPFLLFLNKPPMERGEGGLGADGEETEKNCFVSDEEPSFPSNLARKDGTDGPLRCSSMEERRGADVMCRSDGTWMEEMPLREMEERGGWNIRRPSRI